MQRFISFLFLIFLYLLPVTMSSQQHSQEQKATQLMPHILRFHVIANSNDSDDQEQKLEIRTLLLETIEQDYRDLPRPDGTIPSSEEAKKILCSYLTKSKGKLEALAEEHLQKQGFSYSCRILLTREYFPTKIYGNLTYPAGTYDAVKVVLGDGKGRNWWCSLYPPLAFSGAVSVENSASAEPSVKAAAGESSIASEEILSALIPEEDYSWMCRKKHLVFGSSPTTEKTSAPVTIRLRLKLPELIQKLY